MIIQDNGKMVWSEQLKREIPEGWSACGIGDCGAFNRGVSYSRADEVTKGDADSIPVFRGNNIAGGYVVYDSNEVFIPKTMVAQSQTLQKGQVMIAMSSGSKDHVGKTGLVTLASRTCAFGAFCTAFSPKDEYRHIVYNFFRSAAYRAYIKQICSGTGINNLKIEHLNAKLFAVPNDNSILSSFNVIEEPIYCQIMRIDEESACLQSLRDTLLPLLMNGQVKAAG